MVETATADMSARPWMAACVRDGELAWPSEVEGHAAAIRWAERNGVLGVMSGLANSSSVPTAMREALASHQRQCVARQMARNRVLAELSTSTKAQGVRALLIKGAAVGPGCYPHSWMRQGGDIDIWVPPGDVRTVQQLFRSLGYEVHGRTFKHHQFAAMKEGGGKIPVLFDVHWRVSNDARYALSIDFESAWRDRVSTDTLPALSPVHSLLLNAMHASAEGGRGLRRLVHELDGFYLAAEFNEQDWGALVQRGKEANVAAELGSALQSVEAVFPGTIPKGVLREFTDSTHEPQGKWQSSQLRLWVTDFIDLKSWKDRVALARELLIPLPDEVRSSLGYEGFLPLQYLHYYFSGVIKRLSLN